MKIDLLEEPPKIPVVPLAARNFLVTGHRGGYSFVLYHGNDPEEANRMFTHSGSKDYLHCKKLWVMDFVVNFTNSGKPQKIPSERA